MKSHYFLKAGAFILLGLLIQSCSSGPEPENIQSVSELKTLFTDPPARFRSAPLWDWNDDITKEGIDFQMQEFKKAGLGGVFVHPRPGLITEYLSEEWFSLFQHTVEKGKELDMFVWIYDENSYPSGFAGGHVPADMPDSYRHGAGLSFEICYDLPVQVSDTIEVILEKTGEGFTEVQAGVSGENRKGIFYVFRKTYPSPSYWYGGYPYVDLLYPGVTEKFMEITMKNGYERSKKDFGNRVPGIFTDEPNLEAAMKRESFMRWTPDFWEAFESRWGYDLKTSLPSLIEETGNWKKVRHDYYELLLELFVERWAKPWWNYCEVNHLDWTGHYWEHGWPLPTHGFDEAAFYIWHQMPGVDMLGRNLDTAGQGGQFGNDRAVRELQSAANQAGHIRTLSETYGGGGWEMSFETQKRLVDWECVMGVNFVNQHLSYYSMQGVRKFDYPPSFSYQEPWWGQYRLMGDYIGRLCMAVSAGEQINHILVLQPNTTAWMYFSRENANPEIFRIRDGFKNFVYQLEQNQIEYDLGSENVLRELGNAGENGLRVGKREYDLVVIPEGMQNMDRSTLELLTKYLTGGGKVLSYEKEIKYVDALESSEVQDLAALYPEQWNTGVVPADIMTGRKAGFTLNDLSRNGSLYHQRRNLKDGQVLLLVNSNPESKAKAEIIMEGQSVEIMDLVAGAVYSYPSEINKGEVRFTVDLQPSGSTLFAVTKRKSRSPEFPVLTGSEINAEPVAKFSVTRESENILVVNYLDLLTPAGLKKDQYFMKAMNTLFEENRVITGNPWQHKIQYRKKYLEMDSLFGPETGFEAHYHFEVDKSLEKEKMDNLVIALERPELWQISLNGEKLNRQEGKYFMDKYFAVFDTKGSVKSGKNTLALVASRMSIHAELMPVYILGDFSIEPGDDGFRIVAEKELSAGWWKDQGQPFYSGGVRYRQQYDISPGDATAWEIQLKEFKGTVSEVFVNGLPAGHIAWTPYTLDVTRFLKEGMNEVEVVVYGSLKNTLGFFFEEAKGWIFGPWSWNQAPEGKPGAWQYFLEEYGLGESFELVGRGN